MGTGMRIPTYHGHPRQGGALLGANHMHDPLALVIHFVLGNTKAIAILIQGIDL